MPNNTSEYVDYKIKLIKLLSDNRISSFVLTHNKVIGGDDFLLDLKGQLVNGQLNLNKTVKKENDNLDKPFFRFFSSPLLTIWRQGSQFSEKILLQDYNYFNLYKSDTFSNESYREIYESISRSLTNAEDQFLLKEFKKLGKDIQLQLNNEFYKDVDIAVNIQVRNSKGKVIPGGDVTYKNNYDKKINDIVLQIFLNADGTVSINHKFNKKYLEEFQDKWIVEAEARGLVIDIAEKRKEIVDYLNSDLAEKTLKDKILQKLKAWWKDGVGYYVEAIQATQKVTQHIWEEGTINRGIWHSRGDDAQEHQQWPEYMHMQPILAGATDGVIDEIVGIPIACKSIYEIAVDDEKQQAFSQVFTKDGFDNLLQGLKTQATGILDDPERQQHFAGQTTISVASMFAGVGAISKLGKLDELGDLVEVAVKKGDEFVDGATTLSKIDELKKLARHLDGEKVIDDLIKEFDISTIENKLDDLINEAKSINKAKRADFWKNARKFIVRGNKFNKIVKALEPPKYKFHEVVIEHPTLKYLDGPDIGKPQRFRLDSYTHGKYIVSRKATDFDLIKTETFRGYLDELLKKYPRGAKIKSQAEDLVIYDKLLSGELIMEVPAINKSSRRLKEFEKIMKEDKYKHIKLAFEKE